MRNRLRHSNRAEMRCCACVDIRMYTHDNRFAQHANMHNRCNRGTIVLVTIIALHLYGAASKRKYIHTYIHTSLLHHIVSRYVRTCTTYIPHTECQPLEEPDYGNIQYSISDGTIYAQLECSSGYVSTSGCAVAKCKHGKWSHEVPHCRGK